MEIPQQQQRPFEAEGRKPTHDFLSLYSHTAIQQDPRPTSLGSLRTHDFLLPLERAENAAAKEETTAEIPTSLEKAPDPAPESSAEHILPGGIGTYSISHISYYNNTIPKPDGSPIFSMGQASSAEKNDEHSNCSSYTGSGFTLWEESALKKGKTGKENVGERSNIARDASGKVRHWMTAETPPQLSTNGQYNSFSPLISSSQPTGYKCQSFMDMIKSAKSCSQDDNLDEEDDFVLKKESPSPVRKGELKVKVDGKNTDQKANTPRSKHSATEQRRRSKINDRFQMLRGLIPHGDQKRDKASFLLEVIEYVQFLQEKVQKYEAPYQAWNKEPGKMIPWKNAEKYVDQSRAINGAAGPALLFAPNLDEKSVAFSPTTITGVAHNAVESEINSATALKILDHHPGITNKAMPFPMSLQPNVFNSGIAPRNIVDNENIATQHESHHTRSYANDGFVVGGDNSKEQALTIEGGTINISSVYSQGLLNTLTQALQSSGVDLSQASISVQIELAKQASRRPSDPTSTIKDNKVASNNQGILRTRVSSGEESNQALKKLRTSKS